jgi:hypothetical protein
MIIDDIRLEYIDAQIELLKMQKEKIIEEIKKAKTKFDEEDFDGYVWIVDADGAIDSIPYCDAEDMGFDFESRRAFLSRGDAERFRDSTQLLADTMFYKRLHDNKEGQGYFIVKSRNGHKYTATFCVSAPYPGAVGFSNADTAIDCEKWLNKIYNKGE